jgi:hypothetical protein
MVYVPPDQDAIDEIARQRFAFLLQCGFTLDPEPPKKQLRREGFRHMMYRSPQWGVRIYFEYREGYYDVNLVPLENGNTIAVPFGKRTMWGLELFLSEVLGLHDEELSKVLPIYEAASLEALITNAFAERVFTIYADVLARHLDAIVASPHPPMDRIDTPSGK